MLLSFRLTRYPIHTFANCWSYCQVQEQSVTASHFRKFSSSLSAMGRQSRESTPLRKGKEPHSEESNAGRIPSCIQAHPRGTLVSVHAKPGAKVAGITGNYFLSTPTSFLFFPILTSLELLVRYRHFASSNR